MSEFLSSRWLLWLGIIAWVPVGYGLVLEVAGDANDQTLAMVNLYGATLLIFLAGVRFGAGLMSGNLVPISVRLAPLAGFVGIAAIWSPLPIALAVLVVGYGAQGALDVWAGTAGRLPRHYVRARVVMTWLMAVSLLAILVLNGRA